MQLNNVKAEFFIRMILDIHWNYFNRILVLSNYHIMLITWFGGPKAESNGIPCPVTRYRIVIGYCFNLK